MNVRIEPGASRGIASRHAVAYCGNMVCYLPRILSIADNGSLRCGCAILSDMGEIITVRSGLYFPPEIGYDPSNTGSQGLMRAAALAGMRCRTAEVRQRLRNG
jgi:hypothetical protein